GAGLFAAPNGCGAAPGLTKFRQITRMMLPGLNRVFGSVGAIRTAQHWTCARHSPALNARPPPTLKETLMKKTLAALAAAATVATAIAATPTPADARCWGCAVGAGVLGGFVAGAIVGNAVAN